FPVALKPEDPVSWLDVQFEGRKKAFVIKDFFFNDTATTDLYTHVDQREQRAALNASAKQNKSSSD
ncbi:hypothetical protein J7T90_02265, partial [Lactobacillus delbrueckii subsp. lactis]|nr:hypothetical protein [Lactobacillus delbrueckii subsp. lactis]